MLRHGAPSSSTATSRLTRAIWSSPTSARGRNVLAKFARPTNIPPRSSPWPAASSHEAFETTATEPVVASLQEVPKPGTKATSKMAATLPAMEPIGVAETKPSTAVPADEQKMRVAGVVIPAKPVPPGEEGMYGCMI